MGLGVFLSPNSAFAACVNPVGVEGEQVFNSTYRNMQFCNGVDWIAMGYVRGPSIACNAPWGSVIDHGADVMAFQNATVPFGNICNGETRICDEGILSGSYINQTCTVDSPVGCSLPWGGTTASGTNVTAYQNANEPFGGSCTSETRNCFNGTLDGTYANQTCSVDDGSCTLPWGGSIATGANITAYQNASEPPGGSCTSEVRNCTVGSLSGSYTNQNCSVQVADTTPNSFNFSNQSGVSRSSLIYSNTLTITGINSPTSVSISGSGSPRFSINGGGYVTSGTITSGQTLRLRLTSSGSYSSSISATVNVGGVTDGWSVTTESIPYTYNWQTGGWSSCSVSCGGGTQSRTVYCRRSDGSTVADFYCGGGKPSSSQSCNTQSCGTSCGTLVQRQWSVESIVGPNHQSSTQLSASSCRSWCDANQSTQCCQWYSTTNTCRLWTVSSCKSKWQFGGSSTSDPWWGVRCN